MLTESKATLINRFTLKMSRESNKYSRNRLDGYWFYFDRKLNENIGKDFVKKKSGTGGGRTVLSSEKNKLMKKTH